MGWTGTYGIDFEQALQEAESERGGKTLERLVTRTRGTTERVVYELVSWTDGSTVAFVTLLRPCKAQGLGRDAGWEWKIMDECMGPYYYQMPVEWLAQLSPPLSEGSQRWRLEVARRSSVDPKQGGVAS